jgi:hypothetical protein
MPPKSLHISTVVSAPITPISPLVEDNNSQSMVSSSEVELEAEQMFSLQSPAHFRPSNAASFSSPPANAESSSSSALPFDLQSPAIFRGLATPQQNNSSHQSSQSQHHLHRHAGISPPRINIANSHSQQHSQQQSIQSTATAQENEHEQREQHGGEAAGGGGGLPFDLQSPAAWRGQPTPQNQINNNNTSNANITDSPYPTQPIFHDQYDINEQQNINELTETEEEFLDLQR